MQRRIIQLLATLGTDLIPAHAPRAIPHHLHSRTSETVNNCTLIVHDFFRKFMNGMKVNFDESDLYEPLFRSRERKGFSETGNLFFSKIGKIAKLVDKRTVRLCARTN